MTHTHALHMNILCLMNIGSQEAAGAAVPGGMRKHHPPPRSAADCRGNRRLRQKQGDGKHALCMRAATCRQCMPKRASGAYHSDRLPGNPRAGVGIDRSVLCCAWTRNAWSITNTRSMAKTRGCSRREICGAGNHTRAVFVMLLVRVMLRSCLRRGTSHACSACSTRLECTCSDTTPAQRHWRRKSPHIVRRRSRHCARWARSKRRSPEQAAAARSSGVVWPPSVPVYSTPRVHGITRLKWAERMSTAGVGAAQAPESIGHAVLARDTPHVSQERVGRGGCAWCGGM